MEYTLYYFYTLTGTTVNDITIMFTGWPLDGTWYLVLVGRISVTVQSIVANSTLCNVYLYKDVANSVLNHRF